MYSISFLILACSSEGSKVGLDNTAEVDMETIDVDTISSDVFKSWYRDHRTFFKAERKLNNVFVSAEFIPGQLKQFKETKKWLSDETSDYLSNEYYQFELGVKEQNVDFFKAGISNLDYQSLVTYLSFEIKKDIFLEVGSSRYPCKFSVFERSFGIKKNATLNLVFQKVTKKGDRRIVYKDKILNLGILKLKVIDSTLIEALPVIKG